MPKVAFLLIPIFFCNFIFQTFINDKTYLYPTFTTEILTMICLGTMYIVETILLARKSKKMYNIYG